jgi:hypothetical protein
MKNLKKGIWLYFLLLIFEGALRKWLPFCLTPLLVIRDPLAIYLLFTAYPLIYFQNTNWSVMLWIGIECFTAEMSLLVTVIYMLPFMKRGYY